MITNIAEIEGRVKKGKEDKEKSEIYMWYEREERVQKRKRREREKWNIYMWYEREAANISKKEERVKTGK